MEELDGMALQFRSLRSGSSGNCLMLWTDETRILIDCGIRSQYRCRDLLEKHVPAPSKIDAVVVSHAHGDHVCYDSLRVLEDLGVPVHCHEESLPQIYDKHRVARCRGVIIKTFQDRPLHIGDFQIKPVRVSHDPRCPTHGFVIRCRQGQRSRKIVVVTDFNDYNGLLPHFTDADFIFVEANHDLELLRKRFNPNSLFHMENAKAGWLLSHALERSTSSPVAVMLGHLSEERNSRRIALETVEDILRRQQVPIEFDLHAAPRYEASATITIA